jgi:hypothetical protein
VGFSCCAFARGTIAAAAKAAPLTPKNLRRVGTCDDSFDISAFPLFPADLEFSGFPRSD